MTSQNITLWDWKLFIVTSSFPQNLNIDFLVFPCSQNLPLFPCFIFRRLVPCFPEINALVPLFSKSPSDGMCLYWWAQDICSQLCVSIPHIKCICLRCVRYFQKTGSPSYTLSLVKYCNPPDFKFMARDKNFPRWCNVNVKPFVCFLYC